jgi:hypothetical protein
VRDPDAAATLSKQDGVLIDSLHVSGFVAWKTADRRLRHLALKGKLIVSLALGCSGRSWRDCCAGNEDRA